LTRQPTEGLPRERSAALHVRRGEFHFRAGESHQAPSAEVLVAAINRVREHPFHCVSAHGIEEGDCRGPRELARFALFERGDDLILLRGGKTPEWVSVGFAAVRIE